MTLRRPVGGATGARVRDVVATLVVARCRDGPVGDLQDGGHAIGLVRVADADAPRATGCGQPAGHDVAAGVDPVVPSAGRVEQPGGLLDRPALDVAGRIDATVSPVPAGVEGAAGDRREVVAGREDMANIEAGVRFAELAPHRAG